VECLLRGHGNVWKFRMPGFEGKLESRTLA
jgi:hypothetical protein